MHIPRPCNECKFCSCHCAINKNPQVPTLCILGINVGFANCLKFRHYKENKYLYPNSLNSTKDWVYNSVSESPDKLGLLGRDIPIYEGQATKPRRFKSSLKIDIHIPWISR